MLLWRVCPDIGKSKSSVSRILASALTRSAIVLSRHLYATFRDFVRFGLVAGTKRISTRLSRAAAMKVPSLRDVWYRNAFGHSGQAETLEEWFDPARLGEDYLPKGFHFGPGPIKGHEFGTRLPLEDRRALIAFLKTL